MLNLIELMILKTLLIKENKSYHRKLQDLDKKDS